MEAHPCPPVPDDYLPDMDLYALLSEVLTDLDSIDLDVTEELVEGGHRLIVRSAVGTFEILFRPLD